MNCIDKMRLYSTGYVVAKIRVRMEIFVESTRKFDIQLTWRNQTHSTLAKEGKWSLVELFTRPEIL